MMTDLPNTEPKQLPPPQPEPEIVPVTIQSPGTPIDVTTLHEDLKKVIPAMTAIGKADGKPFELPFTVQASETLTTVILPVETIPSEVERTIREVIAKNAKSVDPRVEPPAAKNNTISVARETVNAVKLQAEMSAALAGVPFGLQAGGGQVRVDHDAGGEFTAEHEAIIRKVIADHDDTAKTAEQKAQEASQQARKALLETLHQEADWLASNPAQTGYTNETINRIAGDMALMMQALWSVLDRMG